MAEFEPLPLQAPRAIVLVNEFFGREDLEVLGGGDPPTQADFVETLLGGAGYELEYGQHKAGESGGFDEIGWYPTNKDHYIWFDLGQISSAGFIQFEILLEECPPQGTWSGYHSPECGNVTDYLDKWHPLRVVQDNSAGFTVVTEAPSAALELTTGCPAGTDVFKFSNCEAPDWDNCGSEKFDCEIVNDWTTYRRIKIAWVDQHFEIWMDGAKKGEWEGPRTEYRYFCIGNSDDNGDPYYELPVVVPHFRNVSAAGTAAFTQGLWGIYGQDWFIWDDPDYEYDEGESEEYKFPQVEATGWDERFRKPPMVKALERHKQFERAANMEGKWFSEYIQIVNPDYYNDVTQPSQYRLKDAPSLMP